MEIDFDRPLLHLGAVDDPDGVDFTRVLGASLLEDEALAVADATEGGFVWVFDRDGTLRSRVGEPREGPGGFLGLRWVRRDPIRVGWVAYDGRKREFTYVDSAGEVVDTQRDEVDGPGGGVVAPRAGPLPDGRFVYEVRPWLPPSSDGTVNRPIVELFVSDPRGGDPIEVGTVANSETYLHQGEGFFSRALPFGRRTSVFAQGWKVMWATGDDAGLESLDVQTGEGVSVPLPVAHRPLGREELQNFRSAWFRDVREGFGEDGERQIRLVEEGIEYPSTLPPYTKVMGDPWGFIWLRVSHPDEAGAAEYVVVDGSGNRVHAVTLPPNEELIELGSDAVVTRLRDDLDVESIRVFSRTCSAQGA